MLLKIRKKKSTKKIKNQKKIKRTKNQRKTKKEENLIQGLEAEVNLLIKINIKDREVDHILNNLK